MTELRFSGRKMSGYGTVRASGTMAYAILSITAILCGLI